jgi:hypothetical protein
MAASPHVSVFEAIASSREGTAGAVLRVALCVRELSALRADRVKARDNAINQSRKRVFLAILLEFEV